MPFEQYDDAGQHERSGDVRAGSVRQRMKNGGGVGDNGDEQHTRESEPGHRGPLSIRNNGPAAKA